MNEAEAEVVDGKPRAYVKTSAKIFLGLLFVTFIGICFLLLVAFI